MFNNLSGSVLKQKRTIITCARCLTLRVWARNLVGRSKYHIPMWIPTVKPLGRRSLAVLMSMSFAAAGEAGWKRGWWEVSSPRKAGIDNPLMVGMGLDRVMHSYRPSSSRLHESSCSSIGSVHNLLCCSWIRCRRRVPCMGWMTGCESETNESVSGKLLFQCSDLATTSWVLLQFRAYQLLCLGVSTRMIHTRYWNLCKGRLMHSTNAEHKDTHRDVLSRRKKRMVGVCYHKTD